MAAVPKRGQRQLPNPAAAMADRRVVGPRGASGGFYQDDATGRSRLFDASGDDGIDPEAAAVMMQCEARHQQEQEEIGPRPLAGRAIQAEPQIGNLQGPDDAAEP